MSINDIPDHPGVCWCGGTHRPAEHREVEQRFYRKNVAR